MAEVVVFANLVADACAARQWRAKELRRALRSATGLRRSLDQLPSVDSIRGWLTGHKPIPDDLAEALAELFDLPKPVVGDSSISKARIRPPASGWEPEPASTTKLDTTMARLDARNTAAIEALNDAGIQTTQLFRHMGAHHFFVSTTTTLRLMVLEPEEKANKALIDWRAQAIMNGALFAMITPTRHLSNLLRKTYKIDPAEPHAEFVNRFNDFRQRIVERVRERSPRGAEEIVYTHLQRFESDTFPLTPAGWSVSLYGHRRQLRQEADMRCIVRGVFGNRNKLLLWPKADGRFERWLQAFARLVMAKRKRELNERSNARHRYEGLFIRCFNARMDGHPDPIGFPSPATG